MNVKGVVVDGRTWLPFSVQFTSPDGEFNFVIYAISMEHAHLQVEAIRETATVGGQIINVLPC